MTIATVLTGGELPYYLAPFLFVLMGFRHGLDSDHVAALSDLIIMEKTRASQVAQGILYASGHSLVVLIMGLLAAILGLKLSSEYASWMEFAVGVTLTVLGGIILISGFRSEDYTYESKISLIAKGLEKLTGGHFHLNGKKGHSKSSGIFMIGVIHGIGAETPTQLALITSSAGLADGTLILLQIVLFTAGVLVSTVFLVYTLSWTLTRLKKRDTIFRILGWVTGSYSVFLGATLIYGSGILPI